MATDIIKQHIPKEKALDKNISLNTLLLDSLPHPAMLINNKRMVLAANKIATDAGVEIGKFCWDTFGHSDCLYKEHKQRLKDDPDCFKNDILCTFCLADELIKTGVTQNDPAVSAFEKVWDTWWVPVQKDLYLHYAIDVTEKLQAVKQLEASNKKFLKIMDGLEAIVYVADIETYEILYINQYTMDQFGDFVNKKCWQYIHKEQKGPCSFCKTKTLLQKNSKDIIAWEHQNTRNAKWYQCRDLCISWTDNRLVRLHIAMDITLNKEIEIHLETMVKEKTSSLTREITLRKQTEVKLIQKSKYLEQANLALKSMLDHRDTEKRAIEANIFVNIKKYILPYIEDIEKLKPGEEILVPVNIVKTAISQLMSPASQTLFSKYLDFTPMEVKVADLVKQGMQSKEIGQFLNIAKSSVSTYRNNIRKKLNLSNTKTNLRVYLNSFQP
jgi:DNA-binding CsgD family transcriptional regulator